MPRLKPPHLKRNVSKLVSGGRHRPVGCSDRRAPPPAFLFPKPTMSKSRSLKPSRSPEDRPADPLRRAARRRGARYLVSRPSRVNRLCSARRGGDHFGEPPEGEERGVYRSRLRRSTAFVQIVEAFAAARSAKPEIANTRPEISWSTPCRTQRTRLRRHPRRRRNRAESSSLDAAFAPNWKSSPEPERLSSMERFASVRKQKTVKGSVA